MGKFHPHGDQAIYGTPFVRRAGLRLHRYRWSTGQGNFGNYRRR